MSDAREKAIHELWLLVCANMDQDSYEIDPKEVSDILDRYRLVAIDPALVDKVRAASDTDEPGQYDIGGGVSSRDYAKIALADAVLEQLGPPQRE